ncbi:LysR family transcriptional regulator [Aliiglaciecola sp. CAU 1673]|uniref:LysR family transcriptional regulator n=1 Tax=Aliiglaciecola sp. CAU 1673 TaxID=3032595 RepID=UPI0023DC6DD1|nr:LysR family transcriptional regulator [Aliiglaciecola sp. CAU 1673]MDF2177340.1 LysR family transcriptional regulator [Aliiglaciecola sp. CAU 1673]
MRHQEINLLMIFDAIMTEGSITRAADRMAMTQPAVSNALSRMRSAWKDELFVKDGRGIQPTVYAQNLWAQIRAPLQQLEEAVDPTVFDPATAKRTFRIMTADVMVDIAWIALRKLVETQAPNINIHAVPARIVTNEKALHDAEVDLVIGASPARSNVIHSEYLFSPKYVCVMRPDHPLTRTPLTLENFAKAEHLLVSISGDVVGVTDEALAKLGMRRRVAMTVNHFGAVVPLVKSSDLICVIPSTVVERAIFEDELAVYEVPVELEPTQITAMWHKRQERDAGLMWLKGHLNGLIKSHVQRHFEALNRCCRNRGCQKAMGEGSISLPDSAVKDLVKI